MRIVLSRKGFDSAAGGGPSPVLEDGTMLSLPIPEFAGKGHVPKNLDTAGWHKYDDLNLLPEIITYCKEKGTSEFCHLDPDIRPDLWYHCEKWQPTFGQCNAAGGHLKNQLDLNNIEQENILFLFFGLFRHWTNNKFTSKPFHAVWGYMVCDEVIEKQHNMPPYHPHRKLKKAPNDSNDFNNLLFIAKDECYGTFKFCEELVLTDLEAIPYAKTKWKIAALPWFEYLKDKSVTMTYHNSEKSFPADKNYFQTCQGYGQEFVVSPGVADNPELNWKNCSFSQILSNLKEMYPEKENNQ